MKGKNLRKAILSRRDQLAERERVELSRRIIKKLCALEEVREAVTVFLYVDFRSEVKTRELIPALVAEGKTVVVPVTLVQERRLLPVAITDPDHQLSPGYCGIPEPIEAIRATHQVAPSTIDLILLPGSVFDERGGRLGYGGGYYDRFVALEAPRAVRLGLAYELQLVPEAPLQPHDQLMDLIVTEKRTLRTRP